jgi:hypothetical protein
MFFKLRSQSLLKTKLLLNYYKKLLITLNTFSINEKKTKKQVKCGGLNMGNCGGLHTISLNNKWKNRRRKGGSRSGTGAIS